MPVTNITSDLDNRTLTITAEFAAPVERVWQVYADPRQLEKVWGPPTFPATFHAHDLTPGGRMNYIMKGPDGEQYAGIWEITAVSAPRRFEFDDAFADTDFNKNTDMPVSKNVYTFEPSATGGTTATYVSVYASAEGLQQVLEMGMEEGATESINQIDVLLAAG